MAAKKKTGPEVEHEPYAYELYADTVQTMKHMIKADHMWIEALLEHDCDCEKQLSHAEGEISRLAQWFLDNAPELIKEGSAVDNAIFYLDNMLSQRRAQKEPEKT